MKRERCWELPGLLRDTSGVFSPEEYLRLARAASRTAQMVLEETVVEYETRSESNAAQDGGPS